MPVATRQTNLFVSEDWRVIYRSFTEVSFAAYDFDTIRSALVDYVRINFPEDFNDWIESSEFVAIIELLSYLGQSLAFRADLNTRENFLDTAERRESILRLARFISFVPSRNRAAQSLVKITQISSNQPLIDSNGQNIANRTIKWNDPNNPDWFEQFILILNSVFSETNPYGRPFKTGQVNNIRTELYTLNNDPSANRVFPYTVGINSESFPFEIINADFNDGETFFEREPDPTDPLHLIYRNDGEGNASPNTGFFLYFKQGTLQNEDFRLDVPIENRLLNLEGTNINNTDVYVHEIDEDGFIVDKWEQVPAVVGSNVIFNSLERDVRNIYSVISRPNDQISVRFADGRFGNVPTGYFRVWYRESANRRFTIKPENMRNIRLDIPYFDGVNNDIFFTSLTFSLQEAVGNSAPSETNADIKNNSPQIYYTQDRMVNGEDYNVFPLRNPEAARIKAVNRIHSGFSRHIDINDPTGQSQNVNLFAEDGLLYSEENNTLEELALPTTLTNQQIIDQIILQQLGDLERKHFFYAYYPRFEPTFGPISPAIAGITGTDFNIGDEVYEPTGFSLGLNQIIRITDGVKTATIDLSSGSSGSGRAFVSDAISDITSGLSAANITNIIVQDGNANVNDISLQLYDNTTGRSIVITQVEGNALNALGILQPNEVSRTLTPRVYGTFWINATAGIRSSTGRLFIDQDGIGNSPPSPIQVGDSRSPSEAEFHIKEGSLIQFANAGWVSVISIFEDGDTILASGDGAIQLAESVDDNDWIVMIVPPFRTEFTTTENSTVLSQLNQNNNFGLRYDAGNHIWKIVTGANIDTSGPFSFEFAGDIAGLNRDASWLFRAEFSTTNWRFIARGLDFVFESDSQIRFYHADNVDIVDPQTGLKVNDFIKILKVNPTLSTETTISAIPDSIDTGETIIINGTTITLTGGTVATTVDDINGADLDPDVTASESPPGTLNMSSDTSIVLEEGSSSALINLGFTEGTFVDFQESSPCGGIGTDIIFNVESTFVEDDGFINPRRIKLTFTDGDEDGVPDDPTIFETVTSLTSFGTLGADTTATSILPEPDPDETELFWESFINSDGFLDYRPSSAVDVSLNDIDDLTFSFATTDPPTGLGLSDGDVIFARDSMSFFRVDEPNMDLINVTNEYYMRRGRDNLLFQWKHFAPPTNRIDPAITNIIDIFALTATYDIDIRRWIDENGTKDEMPIAPSNEELSILFSSEVENKMISDEIIWHPVRYKVLFGVQAIDELQARFKVTKVPGTEVSDGEIKARIISAFNEFFAINNFDFGETFYFTELAAFVHQRLATVISSIVLVPLDEEQKFGELFQVRSDPDEVFISAAKVSDIQIVESFNDNILRIGR